MREITGKDQNISKEVLHLSGKLMRILFQEMIRILSGEPDDKAHQKRKN